MPRPSEIRVSIDVGCHQHSVAIGLPSGEVLDEFDLAHRPEGFDLFFERIESHRRRFGGEVSVAMEGYNAPWTPWSVPADIACSISTTSNWPASRKSSRRRPRTTASMPAKG